MSLLSFLAPRRASPAARTDPSLAADAATYPSVDPGLAAGSVDQLLAAHEDLLSRIKLCYGADRATFEADLLPSVRNFADFVNLLPATADNYYCEVGGLFRLGLEVGFYALQGTDGHIVSGRSTISTRRHLEPRWRQATFLAGLCSELHRTLSHVVVTDDRGEEWPAYLSPLTSWLQHRRSKRFFIRWLSGAQETRALGLFALRHIVPEQTMQHLATGNSVVMPQFLACLAGVPQYREQSILAELVKRATALVIDRNLIASANRYGRPILGAHLERYLLDAMRRLVTSHTAWVPNQERSRVWYGKDGLFIVWPNAAAEIRKLLEEDALPGIPKAPETILEILLGAKVLEGRGGAEALWTIAPPPGKNVIEAVKLSSPEILLSTHLDPVAPLPIALAVRPQPKASEPAPPCPQPEQLSLEVHVPAPPSMSVPERQAVTADGEILPAGSSGAAHDIADAAQEPDNEAAPARHTEPAPPPVFKLEAPMRLNPRVRDALAAAIDTMNGDSKAAIAVTVPAGVFVSLEHFKRTNIDLPVVLRSLAETGMAVGRHSSRVDTVQHELGGQSEFGFVLKPAFVRGLDPADFAPAPGE
ncbi:MobH family relaxase [uncultured Methylibium sp.]|uniref:MobH family relaxase n=1 Tax=uncultured Methylibium sp. TaxID=381093 RepID=UPI0025F51C8C|nr:MobH family relaxase [uncultured Methylibium sp.]